MDDLFLGVDFIARWAVCHTCANSESTMSSAAVSYSFTCDWEHSRSSRESRSTIYHKFSGFPNERSRTNSVLLRWGRVQRGPTLNWVWFLFDSLEKPRDNWWQRRSESRCPNGAFVGYGTLNTFPSMAWLRPRWWFLAISVLLVVAVRTWVCSPQSTIVVEV